MPSGDAERGGEGAATARYWDGVAAEWRTSPPSLWRDHSDAVNGALFARWLSVPGLRRALKTDLFDEAVGAGLYGLLASRVRQVVGIDISTEMARAARARHRDVTAVGADVRTLPFSDGAFDVVVSDSTLDHFESEAALVASLRELGRVLRSGGQLLLTLDNMRNPIIALRSRVPFGVLHRLGLVPYRVGVSCGPRRLQQLARQTGFEVMEVDAVLHCPRVLMVPLARLVDAHGGVALRRCLLSVLRAFEALSRWPTRFLTGHFIAARVVKP